MQSIEHIWQIARASQNVNAFIQKKESFPILPSMFDYLNVLGEGSFGRVLLVRHKLNGKLYAMKIIRKVGFHGIRNIIEARREMKLLSELNCHYIMRVLGTFQTDSRLYLLFNYLPGGQLLMHTQRAPSHHFDE